MLQLMNAPPGYGDALARLETDRVVSRIWAHDHTVWKEAPTEISNRLGWLHLPETMPDSIDEIEGFAAEVREGRFEHVLLLGMGGSSLAPETFSRIYGAETGALELTVLDSTHPAAVANVEDRLDLSKTLVLVATKSGTTTETLSFYRHFQQRIASVGRDPGRHFIAITDPGSPLVEIAREASFRRVFENDPNIGGRYSALSSFGLVPAALLGVDLRALLERSQAVSRRCTLASGLQDNPAAALGAFLGASARAGRDKLTLILSEPLAGLGDWIEQLVAESTGKEETGILPVVDEPLANPNAYGDDRVFVHLRFEDDRSCNNAVEALATAGHPVARLSIADRYELGAVFFVWELATAVASHLLGINPFDQPNVESAKRLARELVEAYRRTGQPPEREGTPLSAEGLAEALQQTRSGEYVAFQAYVPPSTRVLDAIRGLRSILVSRSGVATTFGFGPRYLHSTGQLHKGDGGGGRFVQLIAACDDDLPIPEAEESASPTLTFGTLLDAQAGGDRQALLDAGRTVTTFEAPADPSEMIREAARLLSEGGKT